MNALIKLADIPRSSYYYLVKKMGQPDPDAELKNCIQTIFDEHEGWYGYRRIRDELRNPGHKVNHKRVQRIMNELGLKCLVRMKKYRSYKGTVGKIAPKFWTVTLRLKNQRRSGQLILRSLNCLERSYIYPPFWIYIMVK